MGGGDVGQCHMYSNKWGVGVWGSVTGIVIDGRQCHRYSKRWEAVSQVQ